MVNFLSKLDVRIPVSVKVDVNGPRMHDVYRWLRHAVPGMPDIEWNFGASRVIFTLWPPHLSF
jgi:glutathione peroxidase-family protein